MRVLVACEYSGIVRDAFKAKGHEAWSCDLLPTDQPGLHYQGDIFDILDGWTPAMHTSDCDPSGEGVCNITKDDTSECKCYGATQDGMEYKKIRDILFCRPKDNPHWDLMIAHPPCTYLSVAGAWAMYKKDGSINSDRMKNQNEALDFVRKLMDAPIEKIAVENPISVISSKIRKPDQIVQPYQFGHKASKSTCLWLKNLPKLIHTNIVDKGEFKVWIDKKTGKTKRQSVWIYECLKESKSKDHLRTIRSKTFQGIADAMANQWGGENL